MTWITHAPSAQDSPAVLRSLVPERLRRFRQAAPGGRHFDVMRLYVLDGQIVEHCQALFRAVEVLLRETIHRALSARFGARWFASPAVQGTLDPRVLAALGKAVVDVAQLRHAPTPGDVVAEVMLGTWVKLLGPGIGNRHETGLWVPALAACFQKGAAHQSGRPRSDVHLLAQRLLWARNRVNHCEPVVFGFPLPGQLTAARQRRRLTPHQLLDDVRALAGCMDAAVGAWVGSWSDADALLADPLLGDALAFMDRQPRIVMEGRR